MLSIYKKITCSIESFLLPASHPDPSIPEDELATDEVIDVKFLDIIVNEFIWHFGANHVSEEIPMRIVNILRRGSHMYTTPLNSSPFSSDSESLPRKILFKDLWNESLRSYSLGGEVLAVKRIDFAKTCLQNLFRLTGKPANDKDTLNVHERIAELTMPLLLDKCQSVMMHYIADRPLCGRMPMPRYEHSLMMKN